MGLTFAAVAEWFVGAAAVEGAGAVAAGAVAGGVVEATLPAMVITAGAEVAGGLTAAEIAGAGLAGAGAAGAFDAAGNYGDPGYPGNGTPYDANGLPYNTSSLGFPNSMSDADVANMTKDAGTSIGLQDKGFSWRDGIGWAKTGLGLLNAGANAYGQYRQGQNAIGNANAAANDSRLSAADAKRRADQLELWGMGQSKVMQPWDENGGRAMAGEQLKALLSDPAGVAANDPAYKLRMQAASRAMGIYGQDSGAMGVASADASSTWYDQRLAQLSGLAGATAAPGAGGQLGLNTLTGSANIAGQGQASGAFGNQAAGAANNARNRSTVNNINAAGQLVDAAGRLFGGGGPSGGGSNYTIGPVDNSGGGQAFNGGGGSAGISSPAPGFNGAAPTINGKPGYEASLGMSQYGGSVPGTRGPYPDPGAGAGVGAGVGQSPSSGPGPIGPQMAGPAGLSPSIGDRTATGHDGSPAPVGMPGNNVGPGSAFAGPYVGPPQLPGYAQQMQGLMQGMGQPFHAYQDGAVGSMSQIGGPPGPQPQQPGLVPNGSFGPQAPGPVPNAQGNTVPLGPNDGTQSMSYEYDSLFSQAGGDLLGNYLKPRGRQAMGG